MDAQSGLCKGCLRTLDEIARWSSMPDAEQDEVLSLLKQRKTSALPASDVAEIPVPPLA
jgi:predicted Fe-S protein YdhL (DUF1289 family)